MTIKPKIYLLSIIGILLFSFSIVAITDAVSSLNPIASPNGTFYTLKNIYDKLNTGATATEEDHQLSPSEAIGGTMNTLSDIYGLIPDDDQVCSGKNQGTADCLSLEWSEVRGSSDWDAANFDCVEDESWTRLPTVGELGRVLTLQYGAYDGESSGPGGFSSDVEYWSSTAEPDCSAAHIFIVTGSDLTDFTTSIESFVTTRYYRCVR